MKYFLLVTFLLFLSLGIYAGMYMNSKKDAPMQKICTWVAMRSVEVTEYTNERGETGGFFAATKDIINYKDAPGYLFNAEGDRIATDSFFGKPEERAAFSDMQAQIILRFPIKTTHQCDPKSDSGDSLTLSYGVHFRKSY
jgi:hypothetical protein